MTRVAYFCPRAGKCEKNGTKIRISLNDTRIHKYIQLKEKKYRPSVWGKQMVGIG